MPIRQLRTSRPNRNLFPSLWSLFLLKILAYFIVLIIDWRSTRQCNRNDVTLEWLRFDLTESWITSFPPPNQHGANYQLWCGPTKWESRRIEIPAVNPYRLGGYRRLIRANFPGEGTLNKIRRISRRGVSKNHARHPARGSRTWSYRPPRYVRVGPEPQAPSESRFAESLSRNNGR